jgi:hypothetical protein
MGARERIAKKIDGLSDTELVVTERLIDALIAPVKTEVQAGSWLGGPWTGAFLARLRAHHALNREPLSTTHFEAAFNASCEAVGWKVVPATSATTRFYDTTITVPEKGTLRLSLKASSARDMKPGWIHISKLTEGAWIQDTRTQSARLAHIRTLFSDYQAETDAIMMLRGFGREDGSTRYELIEIPTSLFGPVQQLTVAQAQASTIPIPPDAALPDLKIRVDRSDSKITLTQIQLAVCAVHGRWEIPPLSA